MPGRHQTTFSKTSEIELCYIRVLQLPIVIVIVKILCCECRHLRIKVTQKNISQTAISPVESNRIDSTYSSNSQGGWNGSEIRTVFHKIYAISCSQTFL